MRGGPKVVYGDYICGNNVYLKSLEFAPKSVGNHFNCANTGIESFEGCPKKIGGKLFGHDNPQLVTYHHLKDVEIGREIFISAFSDFDELYKGLLGVIEQLDIKEYVKGTTIRASSASIRADIVYQLTSLIKAKYRLPFIFHK